MSKKKTGPLLELIVTHYNEPWEVGKKFFDMLALQRDVDFDDFGVIVVQDGKEGALDKELLAGMPYAIRTKTIKHGGPAAARNAGIDAAGADWIMFCDFDDLFTNVCSLKLIVNVLHDDETDVGWMETWREEKREKNFVNIVKENMQSTVGKVYLREMLKKNGIRFRTELTHLYEPAFNDMVFTVVPAHRVKKIAMPFEAYMKTLREDGYNSREENLPVIMDEMVIENILNAYDAVEANDIPHAKMFVGDALFDAYFMLNCKPDLVSQEVKDRFKAFVGEMRDIIAMLDMPTLELSMTYAMSRTDMLVQRMFMTYGVELMPPSDYLDYALQWIGKQNAGLKLKKAQPAKLPADQKKNEERVVVYCGTRNTYDCMVSSAKTLLANTKVDRIYFLTEDDVFPQPLPDIITNINVSGQKYFRKDGANYTNIWTYMCLMRAAFSKILPQHNKVLSLDIDVAVTGDISELWEYDMENYYLAGVREPSRKAEDYINFGVVMMNLGKIREDRIDDRVIRLLNEKHYDCPEQSCFSEVCAGHILTLPSEYNHVPHSTITGDCGDPTIIHYAGIKYWKHYSHFRIYADVSWDQLLHGKATSQRVAVYIGTQNQYEMMKISAKSLLANTRMDRIYFLTEDDVFPQPLPDIITNVNVSGQKYFDPDGPNYHSTFSYMPMLRAAYPDMFKQYDILLSIDNDTIVEQDISDLFETDMSNYYYAAALEARPGRKVEQPYFNTGVMLMNLEKMRNDGIDKQTIDLLNANHYLNDSQDALCVTCKDHILMIPSAYNACMFTAPTTNVIIRHFAGSKKPYMKQFAEKYDKTWDEVIRSGGARQ